MQWASARGLEGTAERKPSMKPYSGSTGLMPFLRHGGGDAVVATTAPRPTGSVMFPTADLVGRSAFLFGLLQSDHLVHDVHDAIAVLKKVAADNTEDVDAKSLTAGGLSSGEGEALSAVFYFPARPPSPDMPWRPIYGGAVLLCVFDTLEAAQRAIVRVDGVVLNKMKTEVRASASTASTVRVPSPHLVLRPAREFVLGPENTEKALLTYLTTPRLVDLLMRRQRMQKPHEGVVGDAEQRSAMESYARSNLPPGYLCGSAARLYAAILSQQSPYAVDWAAARVAMSRGDGVVVPELSVVEPWACGGDEKYTPERGVATSAAGSPPADSVAPHLMQGADIERRRRASVVCGDGYVPMTLQEEEYCRRYGAGSPIRAGSNRTRSGSVERLTELMPFRISLYHGARGVMRGVSWFWRRAYERLGRKETALIGGLGGLPVAPVDPRAPLQAPSGQADVSHQAPLTALRADLSRRQGLYEPPRARHRPEGLGSGSGVHGICENGGGGGGGGKPIMIPRYNAIGSALSWLPGFHHVAPLFVTGVFPLGGSALPLEQRQQRRRVREESGGLESSSWGGKEAQLYSIASVNAQARRDGSQDCSIFSSHHARMPAPFSDSATRSGAPPQRGESLRQPFPAFSPSSPLYSTDDTSQTSSSRVLRQSSRLSTPMISSIAPSQSHMPLHDSSLASCGESASTSLHRKPEAAGAYDSIVASSRGNRNYIRVVSVQTDSGGSSAVRKGQGACSHTSPAAGSPNEYTALRSGDTGLSGTLAGELRAFGGGAAAGPIGNTNGQSEMMRLTGAVTTADGNCERKSSSSASRRRVEFSLPDETQ
ncbi:hypothetical protein JKF63_07592 [Porcisia hertigi]|uniref:Uncharacterized protein n=1 Tax=Porcisia hertigi TaxID=2761500 RepID=A0A836LM94_9TRYP|nr:hypothetical protein JKF63_07592 [Porcisia hertigi]